MSSLCCCRLSTFSNLFSSETTRQIKVKFHVEPLWDGGTKVCSNGPGHMTQSANKTHGTDPWDHNPKEGHKKKPHNMSLASNKHINGPWDSLL